MDTEAYVYSSELGTLVKVDLTDQPRWVLDKLRADAAAAGDVDLVRTIDAIVTGEAR